MFILFNYWALNFWEFVGDSEVLGKQSDSLLIELSSAIRRIWRRHLRQKRQTHYRKIQRFHVCVDDDKSQINGNILFSTTALIYGNNVSFAAHLYQL